MEQNPPSLTSDERRRLREIEHRLAATDPELAASFDSAKPSRRPSRAPLVGVLLGLGLLAAGIISGSPVTGLVGFAIAVQSASAAFERRDVFGGVRRLLGSRHRAPESGESGGAAGRPGPCPPW